MLEWFVDILKYNKNHDRLGRFATAPEGRGTAQVKPGLGIELQPGHGVVRPVPTEMDSGGVRSMKNGNPMTAEARAHLKMVGNRMTTADIKATRADVAAAYKSLRKPTEGEAMHQELRDSLGDAGRWNRGNNTDRTRQNEDVLRRFGDGHTAGCYCCGVRVDIRSLSLEKLTPAFGYKQANLAPSCRSCNSSLGNRDVKTKFGAGANISKIAADSQGNVIKPLQAPRSYSAQSQRHMQNLTTVFRSATGSLYADLQVHFHTDRSNSISGANVSDAKFAAAWRQAQQIVRQHGGSIRVNADGSVTLIQPGVAKSLENTVEEIRKAVRNGAMVTATPIVLPDDLPGDVPDSVTGKLTIASATDFNGKHLWYTYHVGGYAVEPGSIVQRSVRKGRSMQGDIDGEVEISKVDEKKGLVFGWASVMKKNGEILVDRQGDYIDDEWELEKSAYSFVTSCRVGGDNHVRKGVSELVESMVITEEKKAVLGLPEEFPTGWWVGFKITDDDVLKGMANGDYTGFSVHGKGKRTTKSKSVEKGKMSYNQLRTQVNELVRSKYGSAKNSCYVEDFSDSWVVFCVYGADGSGGMSKTYRANYSLSDSTLSEVTEVVPTTTYVTKGQEALARYNALKGKTNGK